MYSKKNKTMKNLMSLFLIAISNLWAFVVAFTKSFVLQLKTSFSKEDHKGLLVMVEKSQLFIGEIKAWMNKWMSMLQHSPTYC